jgi:fructose-1,6-bisphosphatase II
VTQTAPEARREGAGHEGRFCLCESYARVTERAALAGARWLGRADQQAAEDDAARAMQLALEQLPVDGRIVIGSGGEGDHLAAGETIGSGGLEVDLALDPLEGRGVVARGGYGAMSMVAVGEPGSFQTLPDMYMRKMAVGPVARGAIDLRKPVGDNIRAIADAFGRMVNDVTTIVLDRPRHHDLI